MFWSLLKVVSTNKPKIMLLDYEIIIFFPLPAYFIWSSDTTHNPWRCAAVIKEARKEAHRDRAGDSCYHDADGGLRGEQGGAAAGDGGAGGTGFGPLDLALAGQRRVELLLLLLLLDLALQLLLGVHGGRGQGLHLGLEGVGLGRGHKGRGGRRGLHSCLAGKGLKC